MTPIQQQMSNAVALQWQAQLAWYHNVSQAALAGMERMVRLNFAATHASLQDASRTARQLVRAKGPGEVMALLRAETGPAIGKSIAYGNHVFHIASETHAAVTRSTDSHIAEAGRCANELIDATARSSPVSTQPILALVKTAVDNTSSSCERLNRSSRQAVETLESNVDAAVNQIVQPASSPPSPDQSTTPTVDR